MRPARDGDDRAQRRTLRTFPLVAALLVLAAGTATLTALAQDADDDAPGLPEGPIWGGGRFEPQAANVLFATADGCALCHSASPRATALRNETGDDVSPHGTWQATMMANAFRDPYWRAKVAHEISAAPEKSDELQALCVRCHAPMLSHTHRIAGWEQPTVREAADEPLAEDGVSCTVCHQARPDNLGKEESFSGRLDIRAGRVIYGPYAEPAAGPMRVHSAYTPTQGEHVRDAALCGACHTLHTQPAEGAPHFAEQAPYLEWRNSEFSTESGRTDTSKTCQDCHMPPVGTMRIARNPMGTDFNIAERDDTRAHGFVGANAFMLTMLRDHREELGVEASVAQLDRSIAATRRFLRTKSAALHFTPPVRKDGRVRFDVQVENLTGHKLPTAYPSRRVWLRVQVRSGRTIVFESGAFDAGGRVRGGEGDAIAPHLDVVTSSEQVALWESRPVDLEGRPTTLLHAMARMGKDTRMLPKGYRSAGPHAAETRPVGAESDDDFVPGHDTVTFDVPLPEGTPKGLLVVAWLHHQTIPPAWVDPLRAVDADETRRFVRMYDKADKTPETLALGTVREEP